MLESFPEIDDFDFKQLSPYVMQFYIESYLNGNSKQDSKEKLKYLSKRFLLIENKLEVATEFVSEIYK